MGDHLILDLQLFAEDEAVATGVEDAPAAGEQPEASEGSANQTGVDEQAAAEPEKQNNFEKAFAKRLAAERSKWESELSEKLKDYEAHRRVSEFFQQYNGMDLNALMERIELEQLKQQAEQQQAGRPQPAERMDGPTAGPGPDGVVEPGQDAFVRDRREQDRDVLDPGNGVRAHGGAVRDRPVRPSRRRSRWARRAGGSGGPARPRRTRAGRRAREGCAAG